MSAKIIHPEDVKANLRKKHGTIAAFASARGIKPQAVADWLRYRTSAEVARAIADELGFDDVQLEAPQSKKLDDSYQSPRAHRLNAEAR